MWMDGKTLKIDNRECTRCMHCINVMPRALRIGDDRGLSILAGAKAPILDGAQMGTLLVPFIEGRRALHRDQGSHRAALGLVDGRRQEPRALGELMKRQGFQKLLEVTGVDPIRAWSRSRAHNPYIFWKEEEVEGGWERDINEFRKYHQR
jgi:dissimilatory sulfite reductase alpha subunit